MAFENIFDSSLIDYSKDFEEKDKKTQIENICVDTALYEFGNHIIDIYFKDSISNLFSIIETNLDYLSGNKLYDLFNDWYYDNIDNWNWFLSDNERKDAEKYLNLDFNKNLYDIDKNDPTNIALNNILKQVKDKIDIKFICDRLIEKLEEYKMRVIEDQYMQ